MAYFPIGENKSSNSNIFFCKMGEVDERAHLTI